MASKALAPSEAAQDIVMGRTLPEIEDSEQAQEAIVRQILAAEDVAALFTDRTTTACKDFLNTPIAVRDVTLRRSTLGDDEGVYMLIDAVRLDTGEPVVLNTGARNILATLYRAKQLGALPVEVSVIEVGKAKPGQSAPIGLRPEGETARLVKAAA